MKKFLLSPGLALACLILLSGCSTLAVKTPPGMSFISTGDYVPGVRTLGIAQAKKTAVMPLLFSDRNKIKQELYEQLLENAKEAGGTGLSNVSFYWMLSGWSLASWYVLTLVVDYYAEGFVIVTAAP